MMRLPVVHLVRWCSLMSSIISMQQITDNTFILIWYITITVQLWTKINYSCIWPFIVNSPVPWSRSIIRKYCGQVYLFTRRPNHRQTLILVWHISITFQLWTKINCSRIRPFVHNIRIPWRRPILRKYCWQVYYAWLYNPQPAAFI